MIHARNHVEQGVEARTLAPAPEVLRAQCKIGSVLVYELYEPVDPLAVFQHTKVL